jgi:membrane fusion protein, multidrug efflux system
MTNDETSHSSSDSGTVPRRRWSRGRIWLVVGVLAIAAAVAWLVSRPSGSTASAPAPAGGDRAVAVVVAKARRDDIQLHLDALGTVTAFNTVTVRTRVDGQIVNLAYTEGQNVHEGDLLVEIDPRPFQVQLSQAQGQLARDEALLANAKLELQRSEEAREAIPRQQIDTAQANVGQYEGAVRVDQSQIDNANLQLAYARVTAPISGRIGLRPVDVGNVVHANDSNGLAIITQFQPISVVFTLPQDDLPRALSSFAAGRVAVDALDRDRRSVLARGQLFAIDNQIDPATGTVRLKAKFDNEDGALYPNQFVNARLLVDVLQGVVLVPAAAPQRSPDSTFVYVVKPDSTVEARPVTLGATEGEVTVIAHGLDPDEVVVTDGVDKLRAGSKVVPREAGAPRGAAPQSAGVNPPQTTRRKP